MFEDPLYCKGNFMWDGGGGVKKRVLQKGLNEFWVTSLKKKVFGNHCTKAYLVYFVI